MLQTPLQRDRAHDVRRQHHEQLLLTVRWRLIAHPVGRKVPGRRRAGKQVDDKRGGAESGGPPPVVVKGGAAELVRRDDIGAVENLTGRMA